MLVGGGGGSGGKPGAVGVDASGDAPFIELSDGEVALDPPGVEGAVVELPSPLGGCDGAAPSLGGAAGGGGTCAIAPTHKIITIRIEMRQAIGRRGIASSFVEILEEYTLL